MPLIFRWNGTSGTGNCRANGAMAVWGPNDYSACSTNERDSQLQHSKIPEQLLGNGLRLQVHPFLGSLGWLMDRKTGGGDFGNLFPVDRH